MYLGLGCYCLDVTYDGKMYTFDATPTIKDPGRYINHASRNNNLVLMKPVMIGDKDCRRLRIGFSAKKAIQKGEELFFDYGIRKKDIPWTITDGKKFGSRWKQNRRSLRCPLCNNSTKLAKLSQHLRGKHGLSSKKELRRLVEDARKVL